jgi:hypothetical protein
MAEHLKTVAAADRPMQPITSFTIYHVPVACVRERQANNECRAGASTSLCNTSQSTHFPPVRHPERGINFCHLFAMRQQAALLVWLALLCAALPATARRLQQAGQPGESNAHRGSCYVSI